MFPIASQILGNNGFVRNKMIKYQRLSCKSNNFKFYEMQWFLHNSFFSDIRCSHCSMHPFYVRTKKNGSVCLFFNSDLFSKCSYFLFLLEIGIISFLTVEESQFQFSYHSAFQWACRLLKPNFTKSFFLDQFRA